MRNFGVPCRKQDDRRRRGFAFIAAGIVAAFATVSVLLLAAMWHWSAP